MCRGAQAAIVVYDITNQDTFGRAKGWVKELQRQASPNIVIALAGNKADLAAKRAVEFEEAKGYAEENGLLFMETSAKTAMNVNDIFLAIGMSYVLVCYKIVEASFCTFFLQPRSCRRVRVEVRVLLVAVRGEGWIGVMMGRSQHLHAASERPHVSKRLPVPSSFFSKLAGFQFLVNSKVLQSCSHDQYHNLHY